MTLIYGLGALALVFLVWFTTGIIRIGSISDGKQIGDRSETALILIDLQSVFWEDGPYSDASKTEAKAAILEEIEEAKSKGLPIIALRQEWSIPSTKMVARLTMKSQAIEGTPGTELAEPFADLADHVLVKRVQDGFETGELDQLLATLNVGKLRLVGLDFNYCVQKTALAARKRGFEVTIIKRGTLSAAPTDQSEMRMASQNIALQ
ncbi:isochorismatase family protein [Roseobacter sp. SK209-2-6]|uniref:cysteine hydrolase family protein n=1 Tax=Roseobacter sp. SK209-2-6 TaxID=388739 RepID=UPI0000F3EDEF|nr:isochorismatase family cysteine hydrolase [Roseobacter sp. SK209-2-6]EBA15548.1 isochorismatase family protein [Roseobacter sp. SK209-2-6]